jgi:hypothetical protein
MLHGQQLVLLRVQSNLHTKFWFALCVRTCTFDRKHRPAFELTCVCSSAVPYLTHTLLHACVRTYPVRSSVEPTSHTPLARMRSNALTYIRSHAFFSPHVTFFSVIFPSSPFLLHSAVQPSSIFSLLRHTQKPRLTAFHRHLSSHAITAPQPCRRSASAYPHFPISTLSHQKPNLPQNPNFSSIFLLF